MTKLRTCCRSRFDIEQDYLRQWKETTARDGYEQPLTFLSFLWFVPVFVKFYVIPGPLRYLWWLVWVRIQAAQHALHKRVILQGEEV